MNRNEQQFYNNIERGATSLEKIAQLMEESINELTKLTAKIERDNVPEKTKPRDIPGFEGTLDALDILCDVKTITDDFASNNPTGKKMISQKLNSLGLIESTSKTQTKNGTRCFYDPIAQCDYLSYENGYVRRARTSGSYYGGLHRAIYQINKTRKVMGKHYESTARIMIPYPSARLERIAHCVVTYRNHLNKN